MRESEVEIRLETRDQLEGFFQSNHRWACIVAHRRFGKTFGVLQRLVQKAFEDEREGPPRRYAYIAPTRDQAKDIAWAYLKEFLTPIPGVKVNESDLMISLGDGTTIRLYSGENYERLRGIYLDGVIIDEPADIPPAAWSQVIRPCLSDYQGFAWFIGTPKGKNAFYKRHLQAESDPAWFSLVLKASETGIIPKEELQGMKDDPLISEAEYRQEYECDFSIGRPGAIYAADLARAESEGRIGPFPVSDSTPVHTTWDLGAPENTVVVYWQIVGLTTRVIDCDAGLDLKTAERVAHMHAKGYTYGQHFLPHDGEHRKADAMAFKDALAEAGLANVQCLPQGPMKADEKRIQAMTDLFGEIWFHECVSHEGGLLSMLEAYRRKEHKLGGYVENKIVHDWASHGADAFGYWSEVLANNLLIQQTRAGGRKPAIQRVKISAGRI